MPDYQALIDAETWAFIAETAKWYPEDAATRPIAEQRKFYDAMCLAFFRGYPDGVIVETRPANGVPVRTYKTSNHPSKASVIYLHGGGLTVGGLDSHDDVCAEICDATGFDTIAVDYRLLPENSVINALDDCLNVLAWLRKTSTSEKILFVGDSAGGYLAASMSARNRHASDIIGQILIYPGLSDNKQGGSLDEHAFAPMLSRAEVLSGRDVRQRTCGNATELEWEYDGLPTTVAISAQCDPLNDEARDYAASVVSAGGQAFWIEDTGLVHGHLRARHTVERARQSFDRVLRAVSALGVGNELTLEVLFGSTSLD